MAKKDINEFIDKTKEITTSATRTVIGAASSVAEKAQTAVHDTTARIKEEIQEKKDAEAQARKAEFDEILSDLEGTCVPDVMDTLGESPVVLTRANIQRMDSDIMATLFDAIREHRYISVDNLGKHADEVRTIRLVPLKIYISAQNGRQNLIAFHEKANRLNSYRLDYMSNVQIENEVCAKFDALRDALKKVESYMWGVNCKWNIKHVEHVEFEIRIKDDEQFIVHRLEREKRCGRVEKIDDNHYRYVADVFDTTEMLPWIRTFISRITRMNFSNRTAENKFKSDIQEMYQMYGIDGGGE